MKYIVFKNKNLFMPIIFPDHITHSQVKIEGAEVLSAGFFSIDNGIKVDTAPSESLGVGPAKEDKCLIEMALINCGTSSFLDYENL